MQKSTCHSILFVLCFFCSPLCSQIIVDFESYPNGTPISAASFTDYWYTWDGSLGNTLDAHVVNAQAASGEQSLLITDQNDILLWLGNQTDGAYTLQWNMYIEDTGANEVAYYSFQKNQIFPGMEWGANVMFYNSGNAIINSGGISTGSFSFPLDTWFQVTHLVDLDADVITLLIDDIEISSWPVSNTNFNPNGLKMLGAINFHSLILNNDSYFVDDVLFKEGLDGYSLVTGRMLYDETGDCLTDGTEDGLSNFKLQFQGPNGTHTQTTKQQGIYKWFTTAGSYTVNAVAPNTYWSICPYNDQLQVLDFNDTIQLDFASKAIVDCPAMTVDVTALRLRRCFSSQLYVHYCNEGTSPGYQASVNVQLDPFFVYQSSSIPLSSQNGNTLTFELGDVGIGECGDFIINILLDCNADLGQEHCYSAQVYPDTLCDNTRPNQSYTRECQENVGSFDPNDKRAFPEGVGPNFGILPNQEVKYQIRFQNTGTDTAFNITVVDTISPLLDLATLRTGAASHPYTMSIDNRAVKFHFSNILLADSTTNEPGSHGFVNFYISQLTDLPNGTTLENQAAIYFDFNAPVWTNVAWNTVDDMLLGSSEQHQTLGMEVSPNPNTTQQSVRVAAQVAVENGELTIFQANGLVVFRQAFNGNYQDVPLHDFPTGLYWVRLADGFGRFGIKKLVVMK